MQEPTWIAASVVLAINDEQLAEHGGVSGVRDHGLLESALSRPRNRYAYEGASPLALAASYAHGITKNNPFFDGNKRTSLIITELFLNLNGAELSASDDAVVLTWLRLADGSLSESDLEAWITANSRRSRQPKLVGCGYGCF